MREAEVMREVMLELSKLRRPDGSAVCIIWRQQSGVFMGPSGHVVRVGIEGQADLGGVLCNGRALQIETKSATGRLREPQERWRGMVERMGGLWILARSADDAVAAVRAAIE